MEGSYPLYWGERRVGTVTLTRQGLYYALFCRCEAAGEMLELRQGSGEVLGLLAPAHGALELRRKIPIKHFSHNTTFCVQPRTDDVQAVEIDAHSPFAHLRQLPSAYLLTQQGQVKIGFKKPPKTGN